MNAISALDNPYWDAVKDHVTNTGWTGEPEVEGYPFGGGQSRHDLTSRYSWTITDPETVEFVAKHSRGRIVDPLAGSGYWAWVLAQAGVDVVAYDKNPPRLGANHWHKAAVEHASVMRGEATATAAVHSDRTLLLSWPPYGDPIGAEVVKAYAGSRVIYIGEGEGGCCGDDDLFALFDAEWSEVAERRPVQFAGLHDYVTVYKRIGGVS